MESPARSNFIGKDCRGNQIVLWDRLHSRVDHGDQSSEVEGGVAKVDIYPEPVQWTQREEIRRKQKGQRVSPQEADVNPALRL